jgi:acetyl-CoA/propionyl-CoA carboxylase, biotin carboxylase, biotin carboxyl carrier protein
MRGHAIECRINAEDPAHGFRPGLGTITSYHEPSGFGVRVDSGVAAGWTIPQYYDSLLSKLVVWGESRAEAIERALRALRDYEVAGVPTTIPFHRLALDHPAFRLGEATVNFIPHHLHEALAALPATPTEPAATNGLEDGARTFEVEVNNKRFRVRVASLDGVLAAPTTVPGQGAAAPRRAVARASSRAATNADAVVSPIQGTLVSVRAHAGQEVAAGEVLFVVEAMKMENEVAAPRAGTIAEVRVQQGATVEAGALLASFVPQNGE